MKDLKAILTTVEQLFREETFLADPKGLYEPIEYTMSLGGKRIRPTMLLAANQMFGGDEGNALNAAVGIELFHNFTLLHDDLMDQSPLRRGKATVYRKWNPNTAILSGDTMFALAWRYMLKTETTRLSDILNCFNETAIEVCEGQQYDMDFEQQQDVSIADYMMMIRKKTAVLLAGALQIGATIANADSDDIANLYDFGIHLGLAFQLQDDWLDTYGDVALFGKQTGQDIIDNKKTYMILRACELASPAQRDELHRLFGQNTQTDGESAKKISDVLSIYSAVGLRAEAENAIAAEFAKAYESLDRLKVSESAKLPLVQLSESLLGRKK